MYGNLCVRPTKKTARFERALYNVRSQIKAESVFQSL